MADETEILTALFAASSGLAGNPGWPHVLDLLAQETRATAVWLDYDRQGNGTHWQSGDGEHPPLDREELQRMRSNRVYAQGDLPGLWDRSLPLRAIRCPASPGGTATLMLQRRGEDFRATASALLSTLAPFLGPALVTWAALQRERRQAALCSEIARDLGAGWILLSAGATVLDLSPGLTAPLETLTGLRIAGDGRMSFRDETTGPAFRQALATAASGKAALVVLSEEPRVEMVLTEERQEGERMFLGRVRHARQAGDLPPPALARYLGLPPAETRLAAQLCDGRTLIEAAAETGKTIETTRSSSKQVFARMGLRNQQDVVRRMHSGAMWFLDRP